MATVLVTGGTGTLGRRVVTRLLGRGDHVRVLSRRPRPPREGVELLIGDVTTGAGLEPAVNGIRTIVHCAGDPRRGDGGPDVAGTRRLCEAALGAGRPHLVYISIVGVD